MKTINNKNSSVQHSFLQGSLILVIATALVKIIGAVYRIPLNILLDTSTAMGYYSTAYDLYVPMYSIAMAGLPIAISRIIAEHVVSVRYNDVNKTLDVAKKAFVVTGGTGFILLVIIAFLTTGSGITVFGHKLETGIFNSGALPGMLSIAPCLIFCCIMSAYRGYYNGLRNMIPTAVSEVIEALGKLVFGLGFAYIILKTTNNYSYAAAGALLGISLGTAFSAGFLAIKYHLQGKYQFTAEQLSSAPEAKSGKDTLREIVIIAVPIVLGSLVNNITSLIDVAMVQSQLATAVAKAPDYFSTHFSELIVSESSKLTDYVWNEDLPNSLYGCHRSLAFSIYNLVPVLTSVLGVSAIPVLATAWTKRDLAEVKSNVQTMLRTTAIIAIPAGCGIFAMSEQILDLLYNNVEAMKVAAPNLRILGICAIFAGLNAPLVNMLQSIGRQTTPVKNIAVGAVLKIVINFILVGTPSINILGVPIGTTVCYAYIFIANFICFVKYSGVVPDILGTLIKPLISGVCCGVSAYFVFNVLREFGVSSSLGTLVSILFAVIIYVLVLVLVRGIVREDIISLPKGKKIAKVLEKLKIIR